MGLLSGLGALGLGNLEGASLYESEQEKTKVTIKEVPQEVKEADMLFDKTYTCPVCDQEFKAKTIRAGKIRMLGTDMDLRPKYEGIDMMKYETIACPHCGYAALSRYFKYMTSMQLKLIKTNICANYQPHPMEGEIYTHEEALERYKLTLANAIVKKAKSSEKAYICLKMGWLMRGMAEALDTTSAEYSAKKEAYAKMEREYLSNALEGFVSARQTEGFPMCGMDENTVDYLIAVLAMECEQYDLSLKVLSNVIGSKNANSRVKERALDVKNMIREKMKKA
ncbi:MAG: DUF2225 domain-containing protein [Lachnospiraceae bacterium]|nr:DUF2225 domain-containing protein [Lachnospiraceae bacterium]